MSTRTSGKPAPRVASVTAIRAHFPALARKHAGKPVAYFDGPGGTQVPRAVADAITDYLLHHNANTHWNYPTSLETDAALAHAREVFADFLNASPREVAFGNNMTTLTFHLARALGRQWGPGDEIVVTELDHQANVAPWRALARERGVTIRRVPFDPKTGELDLARVRARRHSQNPPGRHRRGVQRPGYRLARPRRRPAGPCEGRALLCGRRPFRRAPGH